MIDLVIPVVQGVLSNYINDRLVKRKKARSRAELAGEVERQLQDSKIESRVALLETVVRELDAIVGSNGSLAWSGDYLEIERLGRLRRTLPTPEQALRELEETVRERRRTLGLPLEDPVPSPGDLVPIADPESSSTGDWRHRIANLQTDVQREKERRLREARSNDG